MSLNSSESRASAAVLAVGVLGAGSVVTQLVLLRELLGAFGGNELVLGVVLANWLLLTGIGAGLGRSAGWWRDPLAVLLGALMGLSVLPVGLVLAVRVGRDAVFVRGAAVGVAETILASGAVLLPFCVVSGYLLALACRVVGEGDRWQIADGRLRIGGDGEAAIGRVYLADTLGSLVGGGVFSLGLVGWGHFAVLYGVAGVGLGVVGWLAWQTRNRKSEARTKSETRSQKPETPQRRRSVSGFWFRASSLVLTSGFKLLVSHLLVTLAAVLLAGVGIVAATTDLDGWSTARQFPGQEVVYHGQSPYGRLVVTRAAGQVNFTENGLPALASQEVGHVEETVHYALVQRPRSGCRKALLVGGGLAGAAREALKHEPAEVVYVELDPLVLEVGRRVLPERLHDPRIRVENTDGRRFLQRTEERFDAILVDVAEPATAQLNRFYTAVKNRFVLLLNSMHKYLVILLFQS